MNGDLNALTNLCSECRHFHSAKQQFSVDCGDLATHHIQTLKHTNIELLCLPKPYFWLCNFDCYSCFRGSHFTKNE